MAPVLPLSNGKQLHVDNLIVLISHAQSREKALKIWQYLFKSFEVAWRKSENEKRKAISDHSAKVAKTISTARRFFKMCRWFKHFGDIADARAEKVGFVRRLMFLDILSNLSADISEDITSVEKVGIIPKGILPKRWEYYANWCQMALVWVEIPMAFIKFFRCKAKLALDPTNSSLRHKTMLQGLECTKFCSDVGKAVYDVELSFASEKVFCFCGFLSAVISTHKYMVQKLK
jgi:hypothetical protein